jgi:5-methyltetrahydrofolate--homocysteine methyltransferase
VEAFLISIAHAQPLVVGLNCSLGPDEMEPYIEELARISPYFTSAYPNAGLPDPLSETGFPETPKTFAPKVTKWVENGWLNLVGGCCGTTPEHIRLIANTVRAFTPRPVKSRTPEITSVSGVNASPARTEGVSASRTFPNK